MENPLRFPLTRRTSGRFLKAILAGCWAACQLQAQEAPAKSEAPAPAAQAPGNETSEVSTRDTPPTFRVRVNLVLVRVVVRDSGGKGVTNLEKEKFYLFTNTKAQGIYLFSTETPETHKVGAHTTTAGPD